MRFQPVIEFVNPVIPAGTLLSHAEPMAAGAENVSFRFVARRFQRIVKLNHGVEGQGHAIRPSGADHDYRVTSSDSYSLRDFRSVVCLVTRSCDLQNQDEWHASMTRPGYSSSSCKE